MSKPVKAWAVFGPDGIRPDCVRHSKKCARYAAIDYLNYESDIEFYVDNLQCFGDYTVREVMIVDREEWDRIQERLSDD